MFRLFLEFVIFSSGCLWCSMTTTVRIFICICLVFAFHPYLSVPSVIYILHVQESCFRIYKTSRLAKAWYMEVSDNVISHTIYNCNVSFLNLIREEEITYIQCSGPLPRAFLAICFQHNRALIILVVQYVAVDVVLLFL
jgi:hypothetical protein